MLETRKKVERQLSELREVQFHRPIAMELHSQRNHLVQRVRRQEGKKHKERVERQKIKLKSDLQKIDEYLLSLDTEEELLKPEITMWGTPVRKEVRFQRRAKAKGLRRLR